MSTRAALLSFAGLTSIALACRAAEPSPEASPNAQSQPLAVEPAKPEQAPIKAEPIAKPEVEPKVEPVEPLPPVPTEASMIRPIPGVVEWRKLEGVTTITDFHPFVIGLLAECGGTNCKLLDDNRVEPDEVELPSEKVWGIWRSDAWVVTTDEEMDDEDPDERSPSLIVTTSYRRLRGGKFVEQYETRFDVDPNSWEMEQEANTFGRQTERKGWAGGFIVYDEKKFKRVPESSGPAITTPVPTDMAAFFEAESGAFFLVRVDSLDKPQKFTVHAPCPGCDERVLELPTGTDGQRWLWDFPLDVSRGGDALTILAVATIGDEDDAQERAFLIHYDPPGRWTFEALRSESEGELVEFGAPELLWPDTKGGLWVELGSGLYHRRADGQWFEIDPPGYTAFANRLKPREFLALGSDADGTTTVYATRGVPTPAPPEAEAETDAVPEPTPTPAPEGAPAPTPEGAPVPEPAPTPAPAPSPAPAPA